MNIKGNVTANNIIGNNVNGSGMGDHVVIIPWNDISTTGNWTHAINANFALNVQTYNADHNDLDQINYTASFSGGTYSCRILTCLDTQNAIMDVLIDGASIGTVDCYGTTSYEAYIIKELHGCYISPGTHTVSFKANGRNASATNNYVSLGCVTFWRTEPILVAHYCMNDNAANTDILPTTVGATATLTNAGNTDANTVAGKINTAIHFDGSDDYVLAPDTGFPRGKDPLTLMCWIATDITAEKYFLGYGTRSTGNEINLGVDATGHLLVMSYGGAKVSDTTINDNAWHHVVGMWDGKNARMFIDGVERTSLTGTFPAYSLVSSGNFNIGRLINTTGYNTHASIDDVRLYAGVLSASQIAQIWNSGNGMETEIIIP